MAMPAELLLLLLPLVPVLLVLLKGKKEVERVKARFPPGPPGLPVIGNFHQLGKNPHHTLWELSKQYGPLMRLQLGRVPAVVVSSAQMAEEVLKTHDLKTCSRPSPTSWKRLTYDFKDVGFSPYSSTWRELRKIFVLNLVSTRKVEEFRYVREEEVERMINSISSQTSFLKPINLSKLLQALANDITCRLAFGKRFHGGGQGPQQENGSHRILKETQVLLVEFFVADYFPWAGWVDVLVGRRARLEKNFAELDAFYEEVIEEHAHPTRPLDDKHDFVDILLHLQKEDVHLTKDHIKGLLLVTDHYNY
uniref:Cytochrome P450 71B35 n=1 Tax=Anthurium amnicola TaxID=1678845 RepID=A0A1D1XUX4_9ARAE